MNGLFDKKWLDDISKETSSIIFKSSKGRFIVGVKIPSTISEKTYVFSLCDISDLTCYQHLLTNEDFETFNILEENFPSKIALNYILPYAFSALKHKIVYDDVQEVCSKDAVIGYWWVAKCDTSQAIKIMDQTI